MKSETSRVETVCILTFAGLFATAVVANSEVPARAGQMRADVSRHLKPDTPQQTSERAPSLFAASPLDFVENLGQENPAARFVARNGCLAVSLKQDEIRLTLVPQAPR